ncbi:MAG: hypothetical protein KHZ79_06270 [Atopobium minutum]|uniref:Phage tail protein n=1 Tax=Atopobium minutum TaxID=1381 RepID=A0AB38A4S9_9ACTN|nr:hypothetical protein [Atopobium minutum]KRN55035.1 hypothetical protein IV72_GL000531 [Atopobium minutum]MBS4873960.1 hypothetical protein [Atopobium minutum]SEB43377.1 hypothetical protein SAMN04489746_0206 [Atopobium minutum]
MNAITAGNGKNHVTSADDAEIYASFVGGASCVMARGDMFRCRMETANKATIGTGLGFINGHAFRCEVPESVVIKSGSQGFKRNDIIGVRWTTDSLGNESISLEVLQGTPSTLNPTDPRVPSGDLLNGDKTAWFSLWRIKVEGISVSTPEALFTPVNNYLGMVTPKVLFTGEYEKTRSSQITLSDVVTNYSRLDVVFQASAGDVNTITLYSPRPLMKFVTWSTEPTNDYVFLKTKGYLIQSDGKTINAARITGSDTSWWAHEYRFAYTSNAGLYYSFANSIGLIAVYGYKF